MLAGRFPVWVEAQHLPRFQNWTVRSGILQIDYVCTLNSLVCGTDYLGLLCCCKDVAEEWVQVVAASVKWNRQSPTWSWDYQCFEQALALISHLQSAKFKCWLFSLFGGAKATIGNGIYYFQHHVVKATPQIGVREPCEWGEKILDPFKGTRFFLQNPNRDGIVTIEVPETFRSRYPVDTMQ